MYNPSLPCDRQYADREVFYSDEENKLIDYAEEIGMIFTGITFEREIELMGTKEQWEKYDDFKNSLI